MSEYFLIKFSCIEDCNGTIEGGLWFINGNFLMMKKWKPNFCAIKALFNGLVVWVRLLEPPIEYYDPEISIKLGKSIGYLLRMDNETSDESRGKYARLCIRVNLEEPLRKLWKGGTRNTLWGN